jgi:hypothetical protein
MASIVPNKSRNITIAAGAMPSAARAAAGRDPKAPFPEAASEREHLSAITHDLR